MDNSSNLCSVYVCVLGQGKKFHGSQPCFLLLATLGILFIDSLQTSILCVHLLIQVFHININIRETVLGKNAEKYAQIIFL